MEIPPHEPELSLGELSARYDKFVIDLLGAMAYGELSAFERFSSDARFSPTLKERAILGKKAVLEFEHFELVSAELASMGIEVDLAMRPFERPINFFHDRTRPADWYESLMKAYVIDTISGDFYALIAQYLDPKIQELFSRIRTTGQSAQVLQNMIKDVLAQDPKIGSRLALWGRRLVGEALTQAQQVSMKHAFLVGMLGEDEALEGKAAMSVLLNELTRNHSLRMSQLGLTA